MTDGIIVEAIRSVKLTGTASDAQVANGTAPVANPDAVAKFQAAMGVDGVEKADAVPFVDEMSAVWRSSQENHQGLLHRIKALNEMNAQGGVTIGNLTELQYEVATLSFQQEIVGKVADKTSNAIQTLIKNQ